MKTSNKFTLTRIILAPVFFLIYFIPIWTGRFTELSAYVMIPLLAFMEFTDYLDGHFARRHNEVSDFGKMFDPFADVFVHLTTFTCFMSSRGPDIGSYLPVWIFMLIVYREFSMNFLRMTAAKQGTAIAARKGGKLKTVCYVIAGFVCLVPETAYRLYEGRSGDVASFITVLVQNYSVWKTAAFVMFIISVVLCYVSFIDYIVHFRSFFTDTGKNSGKKSKK